MSYDVRIKRYDPSDPRLGRHVRHDSRSLNYLVTAAPLSSIVTKDWSVGIAPLDQGQLGSCTGNAATGQLATGDFWSRFGQALGLNEDYAVGVYSAATALDGYDGTYPPTDTGSDGLSVAKVLQQRGLVSSYQHATSLEATLTALQSQAVITGVEWRGDMFNPASDGRIKITGSVEGGHEFLLHRVDAENKRIWMRNSWGSGWGVGGDAYFTWDDFGTLLDAQGDVTVMAPAVGVPQPTTDVNLELTVALGKLLDNRSVPNYMRKAATDWLAAQQ